MPLQPTRVARGTPRDTIRLRKRAARRILREAKKRRWLSPKSKAALTALQEETCELRRSERNALAYLVERMRPISKLRDEVALLARTLSKESHRLYLDFWKAFQRRLGEERIDTLKPRRPERGYYTGYPIGRSGFRLGAVASLWDSKNQTYESNELRAELVVDGSTARSRFDGDYQDELRRT